MINKEIIIGKNKIFYTQNLKSKEKCVYVFLHGWDSNLTLFSYLFKDFDNFLALDFPNMGKSSAIKEPWTLGDYATFLQKFLNKTIPKEQKIVFIVHSFGGRVLLKLLNTFDFSAKIEKIICIGVPFIRQENTKIEKITKIGKKMLKLLPQKPKEVLQKKWYNIIGVQDYLDIKDEITKKTFQNIIKEDIEMYTHKLNNFETFFVWGENDKQAPVKNAEIIANNVNAQIFVIKNANHFPFLPPHIEEFKKILRKIL